MLLTEAAMSQALVFFVIKLDPFEINGLLNTGKIKYQVCFYTVTVLGVISVEEDKIECMMKLG